MNLVTSVRLPHIRYIHSVASKFISLVNDPSLQRPLINATNKEAEQVRDFYKPFYDAGDHVDLLENIVKLRKQKWATAVRYFPSLIVQKLLDEITDAELLVVLRNPIKYGVFVDQFAAIYLFNKFLKEERNKEAKDLAEQFSKHNTVDNQLVASYALLSIYGYIKTMPMEQQETPENKVEEVKVKVRVRFVRNFSEPPNIDEPKMLANLILKYCACLPEPIKVNFQCLSFAICQEFEQLEALLSQTKEPIYGDILETCAKYQKKASLGQKIRKDGTINDALKKVITGYWQSSEDKLIADYKNSYLEWCKDFEKVVTQQINDVNRKVRETNMNAKLANLVQNRQNIWFFDDKENIDMKVFKKKHEKNAKENSVDPYLENKFYVPPNSIQQNS